LIKHSKDNNFFVFNPDTLWNNLNLVEIKKMEELYFSKSLENILLLVNKNLSFDKNLNGDFNLCLNDNLISKNKENQFIYTGCQILNRKLFENLKVQNFSISKIWNFLLENKKLYGYESLNKFYHLTNLKIFKKLKDL
jgi:MurNAc alpha-1-phosphate uridylyltransferase